MKPTKGPKTSGYISMDVRTFKIAHVVAIVGIGLMNQKLPNNQNFTVNWLAKTKELILQSTIWTEPLNYLDNEHFVDYEDGKFEFGHINIDTDPDYEEDEFSDNW